MQKKHGQEEFQSFNTTSEIENWHPPNAASRGNDPKICNTNRKTYQAKRSSSITGQTDVNVLERNEWISKNVELEKVTRPPHGNVKVCKVDWPPFVEIDINSRQNTNKQVIAMRSNVIQTARPENFSQDLWRDLIFQTKTIPCRDGEDSTKYQDNADHSDKNKVGSRKDVKHNRIRLAKQARQRSKGISETKAY